MSPTDTNRSGGNNTSSTGNPSSTGASGGSSTSTTGTGSSTGAGGPQANLGQSGNPVSQGTSPTGDLKSNLSEAGGHLKQAAMDTGGAIKGAASAAGDELKLGSAQIKSNLADGALAGVAAAEHLGSAAREQADELLDKGRDLLDSAAELIRERPMASFGAAFAAGWIIAKLARGNDR